MSVESVMEIVRNLWNSVDDKAEEPQRGKLKREIAQSVRRLKGRIENSLKPSRAPAQHGLLFNLNGSEARPARHAVPVKESSSKARFTEHAPRC